MPERWASQGQLSGGDVVGSRVRSHVAWSEQGRDRFTPGVRSVVGGPRQRVVAVGSPPRGRGVLLVRVHDHQHPVEVDGHRPVGIGRFPWGQLPDPLAGFGPRGTDRRRSFLAGATRVSMRRETVGSEATDPNTAGSARSIAMSARQSPPSATANARSTSILPGSWNGPRLPPGGEYCGHGLVEANLADRFDQQERTGLRDHGPAVIPDQDMRIGPDRLLHLESASDRGGNKDLRNPHSRWSEALSACLITCRTARFMKARG